MVQGLCKKSVTNRLPQFYRKKIFIRESKLPAKPKKKKKKKAPALAL